MKKNNFIYLIFIFILTYSCSKENLIESSINEKSLDLQVLEAYQEGKKSLEEGDVLFAAKKFNEVEIMFPQSVWAPRAALMAAYSYYSKDYYGDAIAELERFLRFIQNIQIKITYTTYWQYVTMSKLLMKKKIYKQ